MESESLSRKIKKHGTTIAFILGFIWDNFMLTSVEHAFANIMLGSYLIISATSILLINMPPAIKGWKQKFSEKAIKWLPLILQFCFGSLFSAYLIFYTRSASISTDWPFLLFLILLVISNELFRKVYLSVTLPTSVFFTVLLSYSIFSLPTLLGVMGPSIFILSGFTSLFIIFLFVRLLSKIAPLKFEESKKGLRISIISIYLFFNLAYFTNIIPPVPLALKEIGVYHSITKEKNGSYSLQYEPTSWYPFFKHTSSTFHREADEAVYIWTSVFAPTKLSVKIFHRWQYYDQTKKEWVTNGLVEFDIKGGREEGFRGYSKKSTVFPGQWRVDVETERKDLIGRLEFKIENANGTAPNVIDIKK